MWMLLALGYVGCASLNQPGSVPRQEPAPLTLAADDFSHVHPLSAPGPHIEKLGQSVPQEIKDHTYLFFINGLDPYYLANFRGQCQYMKTLGYSNAYCGQMNHTSLFRQMINQIRKDDAEARVVVIGYSIGANYARTLANLLKDDGVHVDLLVYLGGDTIKDGAQSRPDNVGRVLNINGHGMILLGYDLLFHGDDIKGAANHRLDARHFLLPTRPESMELLVSYVVEMNVRSSFSVRPAPGER